MENKGKIMENNGICRNYWISPNTEATTSKKAKVTYFRPTVLHDHAASRLVKRNVGTAIT